jgi:arylsulfatase A-like enzyme
MLTLCDTRCTLLRLVVEKGCPSAIDSLPLCCPARATFITRQYAHNHGVHGNFWPFGWYGMRGRENILPAWLQKVGYRTALVGKWLNGYGARDAHGEVPAGFDVWRGLLDASAYDYYNFVMNRNGRLETWGDAEFARKLVEFARIEVIRNDAGIAGVIQDLIEHFGTPPYTYWGTAEPQDYSPDVTGRITEALVRAERKSRRPFFIYLEPGAVPGAARERRARIARRSRADPARAGRRPRQSGAVRRPCLGPILTGERESVRDAVLFTYDDHQAGTAFQDVPGQPNRIRCVRDARWKYAVYLDPSEGTPPEYELYDLESDPNEARNLVDKRTGRGVTEEAEQERRRLHARLGEACAESGTVTPALPRV